MTWAVDWAALARLADGRLVRPGQSHPVRAVVDSRQVRAGDLFIALPGARRDGHEFLPEVAARGGAGALVGRETAELPEGFGVIRCEDPLASLQKMAAAHRGSLGVRVIGITGSQGKTTTKDMLAHVLAAGGKTVLATRGNFNSRIGLPLMLLELTGAHTHAVLEMGASGQGDIALLARLARPQLGVITGIGRAHLEFFGSLDGVADAKWELVTALERDGVAFLNNDDPRLMARRPGAPSAVVTFGLLPGADVTALCVRAGEKTVFDLAVAGTRREVTLPVPGLFNVTNALAAAAVAIWERVDIRDVARGLCSYRSPENRMQVRRRADGAVLVLDAYNANPDSVSAALAGFVQAFPGGSRMAVLGSMLELGDASAEAHRELGAVLAGLPLDRVFFIGPESDDVRRGFLTAGGRAPLWTGEDKAVLTQALVDCLSPESVVIFKASRGVRLEEVYTPLL